jgi:hypothetical protein
VSGVSSVIVSTADCGPGYPKHNPMCDWLTANKFDINQVPLDALIEIRDGTCLGVEVLIFDSEGQVAVHRTDEGEFICARTEVEWHPMIEPPPAILLDA